MRARALVVLALGAGVLLWPRVGRAQQINCNPDPLSLGAVVIGNSNQGTDTLQSLLLGVTVNVVPGANCQDFTVSPPTLNIPPLGTAPVNVTFTPTRRGAESCLFSIVNQSNGATVGMFTAQGTGLGPAITVTPTGTLSFPGTRITGANAIKAVSFSNSGDAGTTLVLGTLTITGPNASDFTISSDPSGQSIATNNSVSAQIKFDPTAPGTRTATLNVPSNDPANPVVTVPLSGTGTTAILNLPPTANLGTVVAGMVGGGPVTISNIGSGGTLSVVAGNITSASGSWITFSNVPAGSPSCAGTKTCTFSPPLSINAGAGLGVTIRCAPPVDATGTQTESLVFTSDTDPGGNTSTTVSCTAVKPDISIMPATLVHDFGNVHLNTPSAFPGLVITNVGTSTLTYSIARTTGTDYALSGPGCAGTVCNNSLPVGVMATYTVTFTPTAQGARPGSLTITSNDQDVADATQTFALSGNGTQATLAGTPPANGTLAFGNVPVGTESATQTITVTNTGNEDMSIASATLGGANPGDFLPKSGMMGAQTVTAGGGQASWTIDCKPTARLGRSATFTVANSSTNTPSYVVNLTCTGQGAHLTTDVSSLAFGNVREDTTPVTKTFTLTNNGELDATIATPVLSPNNVGYTFSGVPATLAAGANTTVSVTFAPTAGMDGGAATLTMTSNAVNSPTVVSITGVGQPFGVAVSCPDCAGSPPSMDFGDVRWDKTKSEVFTITNTATSDVQIMGVALTETADFTLTGAPTSTITLHSAQSINVTVTASPNDTMIGTFNGHLQVMTDLPSPMMLIDRPLKVNSTSPAVTITPGMTVPFDGVDIDPGTGKEIDVVVTNSGDGAMDVSAGSCVAGVFSCANIAAQSIAPGGTLTIPVTYLPTVEKTAQAGDSATIMIGTTGLISLGVQQPAFVMISLTGHGTDRHLALSGAPIAFPATYRNPSVADAPVGAVTVQNTGEAPLAISSEMLTGDDVFTLLDTSPITIPGGGSADLHVRFLPTTDTGSFTGTLAIMHDDEDYPTPRMASVDVTGMAVSRTILIAPAGTIDLGTSYVGVATRLSDHGGALTITNTDASKTTTVRELRFSSGGDVFAVVDPMPHTLGPGQSATIDVEFTPDATGAATASADVFFDDDSIADGHVMFTGTGVAGRGSYYACAASGGAAGGSAPIIVAIAIAMRRRRSRRARRG